MKYRRLSIQELSELETAFIRFLAVNGVPGDEWEKIKETDQVRTDELIDIFSDTVFHDTLTKVTYLQFVTPNEIKTFHCLPDKIKLMGLIVDGASDIDFTNMESPQALAQKIAAAAASLKMYTAEKTYSKERELELFDMMENGCLISDGEIYQLLEQLK